MWKLNRMDFYFIVGIYSLEYVRYLGTISPIELITEKTMCLIMKFSISSLLLGFWLFFFPESPKFLIECGETVEALEVLKDIFQVNSGNDRSLYPVRFSFDYFGKRSEINFFFLPRFR